MLASDLGGKRAYIADFEIYDPRKSQDHNNVTLEIYVGISKWIAQTLEGATR
jgi:predicted transcriptional regulator YdeE